MCKPCPADNQVPFPQHPDLADLAARLRAALDALVPFAPDLDAFAPLAPADGAIAPEPEENASAADADDAGQTRTYRISPAALANEREYLARFEGEDSFTLMMRVLDRLSVTVTLMEQVDTTRGLPEDFIQMLGWHIREFLDALQGIGCFFAEMELIHTRTVE